MIGTMEQERRSNRQIGRKGSCTRTNGGRNVEVWRGEERKERERERERIHGRVSVSGSSLLHFKPKRGYSSGFRRADVLYYCSVEIAILRLHSGLRACMRRFPDEPSYLLSLSLSLSLFPSVLHPRLSFSPQLHN